MLQLGGPRYKTNNKIEILSYVNSVRPTPLITLEPKILIVDKGVVGHYIKPSDPHEQKTSNNPPIAVGLPNIGTKRSNK